jgi:predicted RNase H-like HicB family nuclease
MVTRVKTFASREDELKVFWMKRDFDVVIERDSEGYLVASVPALPGCHTQARSFDKLQERIREAIELCLEDCGDEVEQTEFVGIQRVSVSAWAPGHQSWVEERW